MVQTEWTGVMRVNKWRKKKDWDISTHKYYRTYTHIYKENEEKLTMRMFVRDWNDGIFEKKKVHRLWITIQHGI